mmetsp:Transcript_1673/g.5047  ORF Transcript_1673/g.5047 Transcript_1673/m.5047 type:complete len:297 (+) Transcript_1673:288-1178(+)
MGVWAEIGFTHSNLWVLCNDNVLRRNQPRTSAICRQHVFAGVAAVAVSAFSALGCPSHASAEELLPTAYVRAAVAVLHEPKMLSCVNEFLDVDCVAVPERLVWSGARPLILKQGWSLEQRSTGVVVWQCAPALVEYLQTRLPHKYFSGQRVLELGTGTGFTSIFLALMGSYVTGTDGDTGALKLAQENVSRNRIPNVRLQKVEFGNDEDIAQLAGSSYSFIIGTDLTYNRASWEPLADTFQRLSSSNTECFLSVVPRRPREIADLQRIFEDRGLKCVEVADSASFPDVKIMRFTKL